mmetsp:Transcript_7848/g.13889  ORF Transcript_7848/g.13889 Transcript_7848/m.13889 type:complete len:481 (-) Transcript_7848:41-1483(-)
MCFMSPCQEGSIRKHSCLSQNTADAFTLPCEFRRNMDVLLAQELNNLAFEEREGINEEIHGVRSLAVIESAQLVQDALLSFENLIRSRIQQEQALPGSDLLISLYLQAQQLGYALIHQPSFRVGFLRAEFFRIPNAVERFLQHLKLLHDVLGEQAFRERPLTLSNMSVRESKLLREGSFQVVLGRRDRFGRRIAGVFDQYGGPNYTLEAKFRVARYILMAAAEDEETQKKGLVFFFYQMDSSSMVFHDEQEQVMFSRLFESVPLRVSALHMCLPDDASPQILQVKHRAMRSFGPVARVRARFHVGTHSVVQSSIETFGISSDVLPLSNTGGLKTQNHLKWIGMRRLREDAIFRVAGRDGIAGSNHPAQHLSFSWIECPGLYDVLLGRGKPKMNHVGNVAMRAIVMSKVNQYISATKQERIDIIEEVLLEIRASGGRFLKEDQNMHGYWSEVDVETARQKVGIFFRDIRSNTGPKASAAKK